MRELVHLRSYTRKVFDLEDGRTRKSQFHLGHIHYRDQTTGELADVDFTWEDAGDHWRMIHASYRLFVAKDFGAANLIRYENRFDGAAHDIVYEPHSLVWATGRNLANVELFRSQQPVQGVVDGSTIRFADAFGAGLHFEITLRRSGFTKELVIARRNALEAPPTAQHRLVLLSRYRHVGLGVALKDTTGRQWSGEGEFDDDADAGFSLEEASGRRSLIRAAYIRDADDERRTSCPVIWAARNGAMWQAKVLPTAFLQQATYPVRADTVTSFYAGAGDGFMEKEDNAASWNTLHDATTGGADYTGTTLRATVANFIAGGSDPDNLRRMFIPIDTSGIPDTDAISAADFHGYVTLNTSDAATNGEPWIVLVGPTSQASTTSLTAEDFDQCAAVDSPQEVCSRVNQTSLTTSAYNTFALNATGLSIINKTGFTLLGARMGNDVIDVQPTFTLSNKQHSVRFSSSEASGTSQDPYLEVTHASAGTTLSPSAGTLTLAGGSPTLATVVSRAPGAGALALVGLAASLLLSVQPASGSLALTGGTPTVSVQTTLVQTAGTLTLAGGTASLQTQLAPSAGALTLAGGTPVAVLTLSPSAGALALAGGTPVLSYQASIYPDAGALALTGGTASVQSNIQAQAGALALTGLTPTRAIAQQIAPVAGTLTLEGGAASLQTQLHPSAGSLELAGGTPVPVYALHPSAGSAVLTGGTPALSYQTTLYPAAVELALAEGTPSAQFRLAPSVGMLALTGGTPSLSVATSIEPEVGTLTLSGGAASLQHRLTPSDGTLTLTGGTPSISFFAGLAPDAGTLALTGGTASLRTDVRPASGTLVLAGGTPTLDLALFPSSGSLSLTGGTPALTTAASVAPGAGTLTLTGGAAALRTDVRPAAVALTLSGGTPTVTAAVAIYPNLIDVAGSFVPTIDVAGSYVATIDVAGSFDPYLDVSGEWSET